VSRVTADLSILFSHREFIALLGGAATAAWPISARPQCPAL
jgi:hypothetical protein